MPVWAPVAGLDPPPKPGIPPHPPSIRPEAIRAIAAPRTSTIETLHSIKTYSGPSAHAPARPQGRNAEATLYNTVKRGDDKAKSLHWGHRPAIRRRQPVRRDFDA
ncbi:hypothetical protein GCM10009116_26700 [Brevundimonas basaltis]